MARGIMQRRSLSTGQNEDNPKKTSLASEKRDWENAICSVCMEFPHNAVLLLCSSHNNGCRPYMCATGRRFSNCLDQFKKAYTKEASLPQKSAGGNTSLDLKVLELSCPLCRGQVKGWTVVEPAREYLNKKKRSCMQDDCSFRGTYKKLRKHVRTKHASAKPRGVDPVLEQKWKTLEDQRERADVLSAIRSSMPRSMVLGDYVIGSSDSDLGTDDDDLFFEEEGFGRGSRMRIPRWDNFDRRSTWRTSQRFLRLDRENRHRRLRRFYTLAFHQV